MLPTCKATPGSLAITGFLRVDSPTYAPVVLMSKETSKRHTGTKSMYRLFNFPIWQLSNIIVLLPSYWKPPSSVPFVRLHGALIPVRARQPGRFLRKCRSRYTWRRRSHSDRGLRKWPPRSSRSRTRKSLYGQQGPKGGAFRAELGIRSDTRLRGERATVASATKPTAALAGKQLRQNEAR